MQIDVRGSHNVVAGRDVVQLVMHVQPWFAEGAIAVYGLVGFGWSMAAAAMRRWAEDSKS